METETKAADRLPVLTLSGSGTYVVLDAPTWVQHLLLITTDELQAIVQQAYDQHGIVAQLWTDAANDTPQTSCNGTDHCPASTSHHFDCQAVNA